MNKLTQERLKELFHYSPETGVFTRLVTGPGKACRGSVGGTSTSQGYLQIRISGRQYRNHRLAFLFMLGYFPEHQVDHKNGKRKDNRWCNLREVTSSCNLQNQKLRADNKSGFTGVSFHKATGKWKAAIKLRAGKKFIGYYQSAEKAAIARVNYEDACPDWTCNHQAVNRVKLRKLGYEV